MSANRQNILNRYTAVTALMTFAFVAVVVKAGIIMWKERDYWQEVAARFVAENRVLLPVRGNILSDDGKLLASSLPEYRIFMDYRVYDNNPARRQRLQREKDSVFATKMDSISQGLHRILPRMSVQQFRQNLRAGLQSNKRRGHWLIYPYRISHTQLKEVQKLPYFRLGRSSGLHTEDYNRRKKPFGSLAARTLGDVYADTALGAKNGIELAFDSLLRGVPGRSHRQKVMTRYLDIEEVPPQDGLDIVTTLDIGMQDIAEKALADKMDEIGAETGVVVLMEVKTGEVKALVNLQRAADGKLYEMKNSAINDMMEPGSTFKTASIMVALEDGKIDPHTEVDTGNGVMNMHGSKMRDHNWHRGGYGRIDVTRILEVSSNIGVSWLIDKHYRENPQQFVDGLRRLGIADSLGLQIGGEGKPNIRGPKERYFSKTTLPWMSIGYETQVPPMNILAFYNAIANDGCMVRPKLVKAAVSDGKEVVSYPTEVIRPKICSDRTLGQIREILEKVVSQGLAKPAGCRQFPVAGKTGTAQISQGAKGYKTGRTRYLVSFCGYFPADAPRYSMIVSIQKPGLPASGGLMAGSVFSRIAERVYARRLYSNLEAAVDSTSCPLPDVLRGDLEEAGRVLSQLDVPHRTAAEGQRWGVFLTEEERLVAEPDQQQEPADGRVPRVVGMGAKDAIYLLQRQGLSVRVRGVGHVKRQSLPPGSTARKGQHIELQLGE